MTASLITPAALFLTLAGLRTVDSASGQRPNILIILADDLGYGDLGCFGNRTLSTPHLDGLAAEGVKLTHNLAPYAMCTPSRAAFLTGKYSIRTGMAPSGFPPAFLFTASSGGLPAREVTFGEVAKKAGYHTAFLGKWHLGWSVDKSDPEHHHPLNQGFDYFYGIPLTNLIDFNDQVIVYLTAYPHYTFQTIVTFTLVLVTLACLVRHGYVSAWVACLTLIFVGGGLGLHYFSVTNTKLLNSFLFRNYELVEQPIHLPTLTRKLAKEGQEFLEARHQDAQPFLLVVSWPHTHTPVVTAPQFRGQSSHGPYGDAVMEMDWGVGQLLDSLERLNMKQDTWVYFTSDHGGDPTVKDQHGRPVGGHNGIFWGSKGDGGTEGSIRVPGIIRWPSEISAGTVIDEPVSLMDVLPTLADLMEVSRDSAGIPEDLDGQSLVPLLSGQDTISPHQFLFHYCQQEVHAIRYRPRQGNKVWKLALREPPRHSKVGPLNRCNVAQHLDPPRLYDLTSDPAALSPLDPELHPEVRKTMLKALEDHIKGVLPVPSQFVWHRVQWTPWTQPFCNFPKCHCEDSKFKGLFTD